MAGTINMNNVETNLKPSVKTAPVPTDQQDIQINSELTAEAKETVSDCVATTAKEQKNKKHTCVYMGTGTWKDSKGVVWKHKDTHVYADDEFSTRSDIHYMINYGAILHSES